METVVRETSGAQESSLRRVCRVLGHRRASLYQSNKRDKQDAEIGKVLLAKAKEQNTWGFRLLYHWTRNQGHGWGKHRVYRVYKELKLNLRKLPSRGKIKRVAINPLPADYINQGWSMDFLSDSLTAGGKKVRVLNVMDERSRKVLISYAATNITAKELVGMLEQLIDAYGAPQYMRCDNGPEFIGGDMEGFAEKNGVQIKFSQPGKPTQNGLVERLNGTLRTECLNKEYYKTVGQVQKALDKWLCSYNFDRPHSSLGYMTPQQFIDKNQKLYFYPVAA